MAGGLARGDRPFERVLAERVEMAAELSGIGCFARARHTWRHDLQFAPHAAQRDMAPGLVESGAGEEVRIAVDAAQAAGGEGAARLGDAIRLRVLDRHRGAEAARRREGVAELRLAIVEAVHGADEAGRVHALWDRVSVSEQRHPLAREEWAQGAVGIDQTRVLRI